MKAPARLIRLTIFVCFISHVFCENINQNFTSSSDNLDSKSEVFEGAEGWARLAQEADLTEIVVSSEAVQLRKRSDSDSDATVEPPKKKPVMYSWWMPNMAMGAQQPVTTPSPVDEPEPTEMITTKPTTTKKPRPTRKPRPSPRPKTRRPSTASTPSVVDHTESSIPQTTPSPTSKTSPTQSPSKVHTTSKESTIPSTTTTEAPASYLDNALRIKKKILNIAKVVGGVALIAKGTTGHLVLSTTGVEPYIAAAGKVGSLAVQAAPVAKIVAIQAGSLAASALSKAGNLAVAGAGRAYEAISTKYAQRAQARDDYEKANSNSQKDITMSDIPIIKLNMNTRAIKTSPHPQLHDVEQKQKSTDSDVEMAVVVKSKDNVNVEHANKSEPKVTESASEMIDTREVPKMRMTIGGDKDPRRFRYETDEKSVGTYDTAGLILIGTTLVMQLFLNRL